MTSCWMLLSLVFLLATSSARAGGFKHIHLYMHETFTGPNATLFSVVPPLHRGDNARFGMVGVLDDELRDGPDPRNSSLIGRFQSLFAFAGLVTPPGMQTATSLVFTAGEHAGSMLVMVGSIVSSEGPYETAVVGGTGTFRMARGYCVLKAVWSPTPESTVYEVEPRDPSLPQTLTAAAALFFHRRAPWRRFWTGKISTDGLELDG
ncbi:hypothetical protein VPH35_012319 [Triticum aestivum]